MSFGHGAIVLGAGDGKTISVLGDSYTYKAAKEDTGGAYALIEHTVVGDGPPPHIHTAEEEAFYVLEGGTQRSRWGTDCHGYDRGICPRPPRHGSYLVKSRNGISQNIGYYFPSRLREIL